MLKRENLEQIFSLKVEVEKIRKRLEKYNKVTIDSVKGSSKKYPYITHTCIIEGINDSKAKRKYSKILKDKEKKLSKLIINTEYELNYIKDSEMREILRYKYENGMTNYQVAMQLNDNFKTDKYTENSIRMKINRFFEKK